jgi:hypothetical protein
MALPNVQEAILSAETIPKRTAIPPQSVPPGEWRKIRELGVSQYNEEPADSDESGHV